MKVYVVEVESGSSEQGNAMLLDSVWISLEAATEYAKDKFKQSGWGSSVPAYDITEYNVEG